MQNYMLVMTGNAQEFKALSPEENQKLMEKYFAFVDLLRNTHGFVAGSALKDGGYGLRAKGGKTVIDGPFAETKEVLNGYMIFKAPSFTAALELAKQCPALTHGEEVQVFQLTEH
jgi:hypothetical protein